MLRLMVRIEDSIERGLHLFHIPAGEPVVGKLSFYIKELSKWNDRVNLTGFKDIRSIVEVLLYDTFFLHTRRGPLGSTLDVGSGSGIVAIPLKILNPEMEVFAVDSSLRKVQFQRHIARNMPLEKFHPIHGRIESLDPIGVDALAAKAFGPIPKILSLGGAHLREGGKAYIMKGLGEEAAEVPGYTLEETVPYRLFSADRSYRLYIYLKQAV